MYTGSHQMDQMKPTLVMFCDLSIQDYSFNWTLLYYLDLNSD